MQRILCLASLVLFFAATNLSAQVGEFGGLRFQIVQPDGAALTPVDKVFQYKDQPVTVRISEESSQTVLEFQSPFFENGELSIGIETPGLKKLPTVTAKETSAEFKLPRSKTTVDWTGTSATFADPQKPRKELSISLAEYGAADKWKDVTRIVNRQLSGGALNFQGTNVLFGGDPAPGVVKSLVLNYTLDDDDAISTFPENGWVRLQYNPKDYFYLLKPKGSAKFKFVVKTE